MIFRLVSIVLMMVAASFSAVGDAYAISSRIKDVASLQSGRENQLIGYGLVVGLQGSGDSLRSAPFTDQSMRAMLQNLGISTQAPSRTPRTSQPSWSRPICPPSQAPAAAST